MKPYVVIAHKRHGEPVVEHFHSRSEAESFRDAQWSDPNTTNANVRVLNKDYRRASL
jgi:hypothetical protein